MRTCVGCRGSAHKAELVRLVWHGTIVVDLSQTEPGRGAYLHRRPECLELAVQRRSLGRALRVTAVDPHGLRRAVGGFGDAVT